MIKGLGSIRLEVSDLGRSLAFYVEGLRFDLIAPPDGVPRRAELRAGSLRLTLAEAPRAGGGRRLAGVSFRVHVFALEAYRSAVVARGVETGAPVSEHGVRQFAVRDPDGYIWLFCESLD
ncbi:MAG: VOC family protein [Ardenticatenales bacterium]